MDEAFYLIKVSSPEKFVRHIGRYKLAVHSSNRGVVDHKVGDLPLALVQVKTGQPGCPGFVVTWLLKLTVLLPS